MNLATFDSAKGTTSALFGAFGGAHLAPDIDEALSLACEEVCA